MRSAKCVKMFMAGTPLEVVPGADGLIFGLFSYKYHCISSLHIPIVLVPVHKL